MSNFGDFQMGVYPDAVKEVNSRYPFDFRSIERKASRGAYELPRPLPGRNRPSPDAENTYYPEWK